MRARLAAALTAALVLLGLSMPPGEAAGLSVVWPATTSFNPDLTPYTFTIDDDGDGTLYADWLGDRVEIPHSGQVTMQFATDGVGQILLLRCGDDGACRQITDSPPLRVMTKLVVRGLGELSFASPRKPVQAAVVTSMPQGTLHDFTWEVRETADIEDPDNEVLSSGTAQGTMGYLGLRFDYHVPPGLLEGENYTLLVDVVARSESFGDLSSSYTQGIWYDETGGASIESDLEEFYPAPDGYLDLLTLTVTSNGVGPLTVQVLSESGWVVHRGLRRVRGVYTWDGRMDNTTGAPAGVYTIRVTGTDRAGNIGTDEVDVTVSRKRIKMVTFERTFSARDALIDRSVGSCSRLASPSSHGGKGSLGYYSQTKCRDAAKSSVTTEFGIFVPKSLDGKYGDLRISFVGGAAKRAKKAYLVMYRYDSVAREYVARYQHTAAWGEHAVRHPWSGERSVVGQKGRKPAVYWWAGLTEGARYDIQTFTVSLQYQALA